MTNHLLGFVEDLIALAVQRGIAGVGDLIDIPVEERDEAHVKRFRFGVPTRQPTERFWRLRVLGERVLWFLKRPPRARLRG